MGKFMCVVLVFLATVCAVYGQWYHDCANSKDCLFINQMGVDNFVADALGTQPSLGARIWRNHYFTTPSDTFNMSGLLPDPLRLVLAVEDINVPAGVQWTINSITFVANQVTPPIPLYTHMYMYFFDSTQVLQNNRTVTVPVSLSETPLYVTRCDPGVNLVMNSTKFFGTGLPRGNPWTCTLPRPLVVDNRNNTETKTVWFGFAKHQGWNINFLWRYANDYYTYVLANPSVAGHSISTWCGLTAYGVCGWPWNTYNSSENTLFDKWWSFVAFDHIGVSNPTTIAFDAELPFIVHGAAVNNATQP